MLKNIHWPKYILTTINDININEQFILNNKIKLDWLAISQFYNLPIMFIYKWKNLLYWKKICKYQDLSIVFIDEMIRDGFIKNDYISLLLENKKINQEELKHYLSI